MASSLTGQIGQAVGQPASVRIGVITSVTPLTVSLQGQVLSGAALGVAFPFTPRVGAAVTLLGQSKTQGSDPSSWLIIGMQGPAGLFTGPQYFMEGTDQSAFTSTTYIAGTPICGLVFIAPPSGFVRVDWHARFQTNTINTRSLVSVQIAEGDVLDAGTVIVGASDSRALENNSDTVGAANTRLEASMYLATPDLTPGGTYNAVVKFKMASAGNGDIFDRSIMVTPM